jgi:hypothetical protein
MKGALYDTTLVWLTRDDGTRAVELARRPEQDASSAMSLRRPVERTPAPLACERRECRRAHEGHARFLPMLALLTASRECVPLNSRARPPCAAARPDTASKQR